MLTYRLGEDSTLELKRVVLSGDRVASPHRNEFADELAAFANSRGGTLVLGVDDATREVLGIPLEGLDAVEGWVREICNDSVNPALSVDIRKLELPDAAGTPIPVTSTLLAACSSTRVRVATSVGSAVRSAKWLPSFWRGSFKSAVRAA